MSNRIGNWACTIKNKVSGEKAVVFIQKKTLPETHDVMGSILGPITVWEFITAHPTESWSGPVET
jgi:hypothetical protein